MVKKCLKVQKRVKKVGFNSIGVTIRTRRESWCILYAGFFSSITNDKISCVISEVTKVYLQHFYCQCCQTLGQEEILQKFGGWGLQFHLHHQDQPNQFVTFLYSEIQFSFCRSFLQFNDIDAPIPVFLAGTATGIEQQNQTKLPVPTHSMENWKKSHTTMM